MEPRSERFLPGRSLSEPLTPRVGFPPGALSHPTLVGWLEDRLREERKVLECRHTALCEALIIEMNGCVPHTPLRPPKPTPRDDSRPLVAESSFEAAAAQATAATSPKLQRGKAKSLRSKDKQHQNQIQKIVMSSYFEAAFGVLILINSAIMALEVQHSGLVMLRAHNGEATVAAIEEAGISGWPDAIATFNGFEFFFGIIFTLEVLVKIAAFKQGFVQSFWNLFDSMIVGFWLLSSANSLLSNFPVNPMVLRACRLVRLLRLLRLAKMTSMFDTLVLMISSVQASGAVLLWGVVLLLLCMTVSALVLNSFLAESMDPEKTRLEASDREAIFRLFGTYSRCMITMFEITLASWVGPCRLLVDKVGEWYAVFFLTYKCVVGFAMLKVITGVFLHETFRLAGLDDDLMITNRRRMRTKFKNKMMAFFDEADGGEGDGEVSVDEFVAMIEDERVNTWLEAMDLRIRDVGAERIFAFLAGPDMTLSRDELCSGMSRLRGAAQGLDVVTLLEVARPELRMPPSRDILRLLPDEDHSWEAAPPQQASQGQAPALGQVLPCAVAPPAQGGPER